MLFNEETLRPIAKSKNIVNLKDDTYVLLGHDLEYRIQEICQDGVKFMVASHRVKLHVSDINNALISKSIEPLFGYESRDLLVFRGIPSGSFHITDEEIDIEEFLEKPLPKIPLRPYIQSHWLAVEGVQPPIQQNPILIEKPDVKTDVFSLCQEEMLIKPQIKHKLTKELNLYFDKILNAVKTDPLIAMNCLEKETGIQQLVPYFIYHFNEELKLKISDEKTVKNICVMFHSLLKNSFLFMDPYLHEIIPSIITCIVGKSVTMEVRYLAADILVSAFNSYSCTYQSFGPRTIKTLTKTYNDNSKSEGSQYGALYALSKLTIDESKNSIFKSPCNSPYESVKKLHAEIITKNNY